MTTQHKIHVALTGKSGPEIILSRANATLPNMGLTCLDGNGISRDDAKIAKNYYSEAEMRNLYGFINRYLDYAED